MKKIYIIFANDVEVKNSDYEYDIEFRKDFAGYLARNSISDYSPRPVLFTDSEEEAKDYLKKCCIEISRPLGSNPKTLYRDVRYYDISKIEVTDEEFDKFDGNLEKIWNESEDFQNEEWSYDISEFEGGEFDE